MAAKRVDALVTPELLVWARESAGLSVQDMAEKLKTTLERVEQWEAGERHPTLPQARKWANATRRPLVVLYLAEVPKDFSPLRDFRRFDATEDLVMSPGLLFQIREAHERREIFAALLEEAEEESSSFTLTASSDEEPEVVGGRVRDFLGVTLERQKRWKQKYEPLNGWKRAIEDRGVLVFQSTRVDLNEMRGFSIAAQTLPVIVLNPGDSPRARAFTLLHELAHLAIRQAGVCDLEVDQGIEAFCNKVAAATLVPRAAFLDQTIGMDRDEHWTDERIKWLADFFAVSNTVVLRRLVTVGKASWQFYRRKAAMYAKAAREAKARRANQEVPILPDRRAISQLGSPFLSLAIRSFWENRISLNELSSMAGVGVKYIPRIQTEVMR